MTETTKQQVSCPNCQTKTVWREANPNRPFCSERCRNKDFVTWANEEHVLAGNPVYADVLSDDL